jgi:gliding motility-associated-like protein
MKFLITILLILCLTIVGKTLHAQNFNMVNNATVPACSGTFYDSGGASGNYGNNQGFTYTICPAGAGGVSVNFLAFSVENSFDFLTIYDGNTSTAPSLGTFTGTNSPGFIAATASNTTGCLTFVFFSNATNNSSGWAATISCIQPCQEIVGNTTFSPAPDLDGIIRICQGTTVSMNGSGTYPQNNAAYAQSDATSIFNWSTYDGANPVGQNVSHTFNNEGGFLVQLEIEDIQGCTNAVVVEQEIHVSTTPNFIGTVGNPTPICLGEQASFNGAVSAVAFDKSCVQPVFPPIALPDGSGVSYETSVDLECFSTGQTLTNINDLISICVNMEHSYMGDLEIDIECPSGQTVILKGFPGGGSTNLGIPGNIGGSSAGIGFNYCWTPNATNGTWVGNAGGNSTLAAGTYASDNLMSGLVGCDLNGVWTLTITDYWSGDNGYLFDWGINFDPAIIPPSVSFTPTIVSQNWQADPTILSGTNPINVEPIVAGNACYIYKVTDDFGCNYDTTVCITVNPYPEINSIAEVNQCSPYTLPVITGNNLTGNQAYYTGPNGTGTQFNSGDIISASTTLYIYDISASSPLCKDQEIFDINISVANTMLTCPAPTTKNCALSVGAPFADFTSFINGGGSASWAIGTSIIESSFTLLSEVTTGNSCSKTITRTYQISDNCGNNVSCSQTINVIDNIAPTGTAPADLAVQCITAIPVANIASITDEADNCTINPIVTHVGDVSDGNTCPEIIARTYNIADNCGNNINVTQIFTINDDVLPTGTASDLSVQCIEDVPVANINSITDEADNCAVNPIVTLVSDLSDGNSCPEVITRIYNIADNCGNNIDVIQTITINDDVLPTGTAPDLIVQCIGDVPAADVNYINDEADNCTANPLVTFVSESSNGNTCPEIITRTYNIADDCGNNIDVVQTITINDDILPTGTAPANLAIQCIGDFPVADVTLITDEADNCTVNPTVTHVGDVSTGNTCPEVITRTYNIADDCGNNIDLIQTITINDDINPTGTAPADLVLQCFSDLPIANINSITDEADNCTVNPIVTHVGDVSNGNTCPAVITRTYNIADDCGNNMNVIQTFTINDDVFPTASDIITTVQCLTDVPIADISVVSDEMDNCTTNPTVAFVSESTNGNTCNGEIITRIYNVTDDCGNSINVNHTITVDSYTPNFTVLGTGTTTCDGNDGMITISGLRPTYNYDLSFNGGGANPIITNGSGEYVITGLIAGTYTGFTISDGDCISCSTTENVSINLNDPNSAIINAGPDAEYCEGTTVILNAFNPENANISWNNGVTDGVGFVPPVGTTSYTVTSVRVNCYSSDQMMITVSPAITDITCPGDLIASCDISEQAAYADFEEFITAGGSATIPVGGVIDSASFSLFSEVSDGFICPETITRTYQISDTCGVTLSCTQQIVISEIILPTGTAPNDTLVQCIGYVPIVDVNSITDEADNCSAIPTVTHVSDISDGNTCPEIITRTYNIEDKCGNNIDVVQTITIDDDILPTASNPDTIFVACLADVPVTDITEVTDEADNCTANPTVAFVSESTDANTCNGEQITRIYRITDDCGNFINVTQIIVIDLFDPVFTVSSTNPTTCDGNEGTITLSGLAPNFNYELSYAGGTAFSITTDAAGEYTITGLVQGTYTGFTITEGTCLTCSTTENVTMTLTDPIPPVVNAGTDIVACENDIITLTAFNPESANISWNNVVVDGVGFVSPVGISTYTVTAERVNCFTTDQVQVTINPLPIVNAGIDKVICDRDEVTLTASGATTYVWDNGVTDNVPFTPTLGTVTYTVIGTSVFGCVNTDQVEVEVIISPDVSFLANRTIGCAPQEINLFSTSPGIGNQCIYTINGGEQFTGCNVNPIFTEAGCFDVNLQVELTNGCTDDLTVTDYICIDDYPIADFTVNPEELTNIYNNADFTNETTGATDYEWNFGDGDFSNAINPTHEYSVDKISRKFIFDVELVATSNLGCKDTFNLDLPFFEELIYFIPNTFTPDGNQYNESFKPQFTSGFEPLEYKLQIYNRWGELIFESNNPAYGWDGSYGSSQTIYAQEGTYLYKVYYKKIRDGENVEIVGSVNLLR